MAAMERIIFQPIRLDGATACCPVRLCSAEPWITLGSEPRRQWPAGASLAPTSFAYRTTRKPASSVNPSTWRRLVGCQPPPDATLGFVHAEMPASASIPNSELPPSTCAA